MPATIKIKNSSTASAVPTSSDLVQGELAVNVTDKRLFTENASGTVVELGTNPSILTLPDGSASAPTLTNDGDTNTGIFFPAADTVGITTGGTERARVDSSGNFGLGVTPSAWASSYKALDVGNTASFYFDSSGAVVSNNSFINSSFQYRYKTSNAATRYEQTSAGQHQWFNAASGTAGNAITFTQAMTLDASGNLGLGITSPTSYSNFIYATINGTNGAGLSLRNTAGSALSEIYQNSTGLGIASVSNLPILFLTNNTERARIDSSGNFTVGATAGSWGSASGNQVSPSFQQINKYNGSSGDQFIAFSRNSSTIGSITQSGTTAVLYNVTSDQRLKENIVDAPEFGSVIDALQVRSYDWITDQTHQRAGFIAQELVTVAPEAVHQPANPEDMMAVDYSKLVPMLVKEIQSLRQRVASLEA